jgi:hypothetical protein
MCDTLADLADLPSRLSMGTTCWVIAEGCEYIRNSKGEWNKKVRETILAPEIAENFYTKEEIDQKLEDIIALTKEEILKITQIGG